MGTTSKHEEDEAFDLARFLEICTRHRRGIAVFAALCVIASVGLLGLRAPVYRAKATLILEDQGSGPGVLKDLAMLTSAPAALAEMELLRSRTVAERTIAAPEGLEVLPYDDGSQPPSLGLTTIVEDDALQALAGWRQALALKPERWRPETKLYASVDAVEKETGPDSFRVAFLEDGRVRFSPTGLLSFLTGSDPVEKPYEAGAVYEYEGLMIRLLAGGNLEGRSFVIRSLEAEDALERVMKNTRVSETARNSSVIELVYEDSDPERAAAIANALCRNYLDKNLSRSEKRASQTVRFIEKQLEEQQVELRSAEKEVVELQAAHPSAIDVTETAKALITHLSLLEVEEVQLAMMRVALTEALELIDQGQVEALSRLTAELSDPVSAVYVGQIAQLTAESELLDRSDTGAFKAVLQSKVESLSSQADRIELQIGATREALQAFADGDVTALGRFVSYSEADLSRPLLMKYIDQLSNYQTVLRELEPEFKDKHPDIGRTKEHIADLQVRINDLLLERLAGLEQQAREYERLRNEYEQRVSDHPGAERAHILEALAGLQHRTRAHLQSRLLGLGVRTRSIETEAARIEERMSKLPEEERALADSMRRLESHGEIVKFLMTRQKEAELTRAATVPTADFIDVAVPPRFRSSPTLFVHLVLGMIVGVLLGVGFAFLRESLEKGIFTAAELEDATNLPVFGTIPEFDKDRRIAKRPVGNFVALRDAPESAAAEAYRSLRASLKFVLSSGSGLRTLAVTSSTQGEGKSVTTVDMAIALASDGRRVLLVDADMRRPSVHRYLQIERSPGFSNVLEQGSPWRQLVQADVLTNLDVLPAGDRPHSPGDLIASEACERFLQEAKGEYDLVLVDVPPVLAVADIEGIAPKLDAVLFLCRSSRLPAEAVRAASARLRRVGANVVGAVLNGMRASRRSGKYGYGYGYDDDERPAA